jgi:hypothetical protein
MACRHHHVSLVPHRASLVAAFGLLLALVFLRPTTVVAAGVVGTGTPESCTEAALDAALVGGGMVTFDCGAEPVTITLSAEKVIASDSPGGTTVDGGGTITLSGGNAVRVFIVAGDVALTVENLTIASGRGVDGGGIANHGNGTLTVTNSTFTDNSAYVGGGITNFENGTLTVTNSTFSSNSANGGGGGGIWNGGAGTLTVTNSTFSGNRANGGSPFSHGGGIANKHSDPFSSSHGRVTVTNSTFTDGATLHRRTTPLGQTPQSRRQTFRSDPRVSGFVPMP